MSKSKQRKEAVKRFAALALAFLMVFQYTAAGLSVYSWAEDNGEPAQEEQVEKAEEKAKEAPEPKKEEPQKEEKVEQKVETPAPAPEPEPAPQPEEVKQEETQPEEQAEEPEQPAEEKEEEKEEEEEEEEKYPAQDFQKTASGVIVRIAAPEGALPEGATVVVTPVSANSVEKSIEKKAGDVKVVKAMDISFKDKDGKEIEPKKQVSVNFQHSSFGAIDDPKVFHIKDSGAVEKVADSKVGTYGNQISMNAKDFSIYAIVDQGDNARLEVIFKNGSTEIGSTIVKKSDINATTSDGGSLFDQLVYDPGAGNLASGEVFRGWTTNPNYTEADIASGMNINGVRDAVKAKLNAGVTEVNGSPEVMTLYAMVFKAVNITYKDEDGVVIKNEAILTKTDGEVTYQVNESYTPKTSDQEFQGWYFTTTGTITDASGNPIPEGSSIDNETTIKITKDLILSVKAPKGFWLIFRENGKGASYTSPQFLEGVEPTEPDEPTRFGFTFGGWYTDAECTEGNEFNFNQVLEQTTTVYAKWTPNTTAPYSVIIWKQNVTGDGYDFAEVITGTGNVGSTITAVTQNGANVNTGTTPAQTRNVRVNNVEKAYTGFHTDHYDQNVTIVTEGTSVVNVYYNRNVITINFNAGDYNTILDEKDNTYKQRVTYTGLYEAPLTFTWPTTYYDYWDDDHSTLWQYGQTILSFIGSFKLPTPTNVTLNLSRANGGNNVRNFYQQNADGTWPTTPHESISMTGNSFNVTDKYTGFYAYEWRSGSIDGNYTRFGNPDSSGSYGSISGNTLHIRFARIKGKITYMDGAYVNGDGTPITTEDSRGELGHSDEMLYGVDVSSYGKDGSDYFKPTYNGYAFAGWYADEGCTHEYSFTTMPADGITVYAKWVRTQYRVFLHPNVPTSDASFSMGEQATSFRIDEGESINKITGIRDDYELVGWYTDEACKHSFNFDAFVANDSTVTTPRADSPTETDLYGNPTEQTNKDASRFWIKKELNLYAKWRSKLTGANGITVVYDAGNGTFSDGSAEYTDPLTYKDLAKAVATGASTPAVSTKEFEAWEIYKYENGEFKATGETVLPGDSFEVKKAYAQVTENEGSTTENPSYTYTFKLVAQYKDLGEETKTHITWFANNGTEESDTVDNLSMNTPVQIQPADRFSNPGYEFIGWARLEEGSKPASPTDDSALWLVYHKDTNTFTDTDDGKTVTKVAADEKHPYHDLYAVWKEADVTINYAVADDSTDMGTVSLDTETIKAVSGTPAGSTATAASSTYAFDYWTVDDGTESISTSATFVPQKNTGGQYEAHTYYAHFKLNEAPVTVHHYLKGTEIKVAEDVTSQETIGTEYTAQPVTTYQEKNLTVDSYNPSQAVTVTEGSNVITIYYTLPLKITAKTDSKTYDGTPLNGEYTVEGALESDEAGIKASLGTAPSITHVADSPKEYQATTTGVPGYYEITENKAGTLTITPAPLTVTTGTDSKVYDGTPLTKDEANIEGLVDADKDKVTIKATGSQTKVGSSDNTYEITWGTAAETDYTISESLGTLTVTEYADEITVTTTGGTFTYDGQAHKATVEVSTLPTGYELDTATSSATATDVTTTDVPATCDTLVIKNAAGEDVTSKLKINYVNGTIKINPATLTVTTPTATKVYDGTALTADGTITGFVNNETATFKTTGTQTEVGSSKNTYSLEWDGTAKESNYTVSETVGTLTVTETEAEITVTTTGGTFVYDGKAHGATVAVSTLPAGYTLDTATSNATATDVTTAPVAATCDTLVIKNASGKDVTEDLKNNIKYVDGTIEVTPAPLTVTTGSDEKKYDGTPLTKDEAEITGLVNDETATVKATGSQTAVGSSDNTYDITWGTAKASNYEITDELGKLKVTTNDAEIVLTAASDTKVYDGTALTKNEVTSEGVPTGLTVSAAATGSQTVVGEGANKVADGYAILDATGANVTANFTNITTVDGKLAVTPKEVTITTGSAEKEYDGTPLTESTATITGLVGNETATVVATGTITEVGSTPNTALVSWGTALPANYTVKEELGTLTIKENAAQVELKAADGEKTYDGTALTNNKVTATGLPEGFTTDAVAEGSQTNAGESDNVVKEGFKIFDADGNDKTANFTNVKTTKGTLTVNPVEIVLTAKSDSKTYDGTPLTNDGYDITTGAFVQGEGLESVTVEGSQTLVGTSDNKITGHELKEGTLAKNYNISYEKGTLEVKSRNDEDDDPDNDTYKVVFNVNSGTFEYDGEQHTVEGYLEEHEDGSLTYVNDKDVEFTITGISASRTETDAGTYVVENTGVFKVEDPDGNDVTSQFTVTANDGSLVITKAKLPDDPDDPDDPGNQRFTVTDPEDTEYNGVEQKQPITVTDKKTGKDLVEGKDYDIEYTEAVHVGEVTITVTGKGNYEGSFTRTYKITPIKIVITAKSDSKTYDGTPLTNDGYDITEGAFVEGEGFESVTVEGSQTLVGTSDNKITGHELNADTLAKDYSISYEDGTLEVKSRNDDDDDPENDKYNVVFNVNSGTFEYDGEQHTVEGYLEENEDGSLTYVNDKDVTFTITGISASRSETDAGTYVVESTGTFKVEDPDGNDVTDQFKLTTNNGELVITKAKLPEDPDDPDDPGNERFTVSQPEDTEYNGKEQKQPITVTDKKTGKDLVEDKDYTIEYTEAVHSGDVTITVTGKGNYEGTFTRTYKITPREIVLTAKSDSKTYDGTPLTNDGYDITSGEFVEGEGLESVTVEGSQTLVGTSANKITGHELTADTLAKDYSISYEDGTLEVKSRNDDDEDPENDKYKVEYNVKNGTFEYDGEEHTVEGYMEQAEDGTLTYTNDKNVTFTVSGISASRTETKAGEYPVQSTGTFKVEDPDGNDVTDQFKVTANDGSLVINKAKLPEDPDDPSDPGNERFEVSTPEDVMYDGQEHEQPVTVTDKKTGKELTEDDITITYSEDVTNAGTVTVTIKANEDGNYSGEFTRTYKITPREVVLTSESDSKEYDGTALEKPEVTVTGDGFVEGEVSDIKATGSQTDAGSSTNTIEYTEGANFKADNYKITKNEGTLEVTKAKIPEDPDDPDDPKDGRFQATVPEDVTYNGKEQKQPITVTDTKTGKELVEGKDYEISYSPAKNAGTVTVTIKGIGNYEGEFVRTYKINPKLVTIRTNSATKVFDGTALKAKGRIKGIVAGETVSFKVTGSRTAVGKSKNTYSLKWNGTALKSNYTITSEVIGTLRVTPAPGPRPNPGPNPGPNPPAPTVVINPPVTPEIDDTPAPEVAPEPETVEPEQAPAAVNEGFWALINLICAIVSVLLSLFILVRYLGKGKKNVDDDEQKDAQANAQTENADADEQKQQKIKKKGLLRIMDIIPAVASVITFILTEDMSQPMQLVDQWTLLMVVILLVDVVLAIFTKRTTKDLNNEDEEQEQNTQA